MVLLHVLRLLRRDWWIMLLVVVLTVGAMLVVKGRIPERYEATAVYGLQFPVKPPTPQEITTDPRLASLAVNNPLLNYDTRGTVTELLCARLDSTQVREALAAQGIKDYKVDLQPTRVVGSGSLLFHIVAVGDTRAEALQGAQALRGQARTVLAALQGKAAAGTAYQVSLLDVSIPVDAEKAMVDRFRILAVVALMGFLVLLTVLSIRTNLRAAREAAADDEGSRR